MPTLRILFDQGTPVPLRRHLGAHEVATAFEMGWNTLRNGDLLAQAEAGGFDVLLTTDQNLKYQQNLASRTIGVVVLTTTSWPRIQKVSAVVAEAISSLRSGDYVEVPIP